MKRLSVFLFLLGTTAAWAQQKQAVGVRLGNPLAVNYKKYFDNDRAIEFGVGVAPPGWGGSYYKKSFDHYFDNVDYLSHDLKSALYLQARYLFHYDLQVDGIDEGKASWYWGLGAMVKFASVRYTYDERTVPSQILSKTKTDIDFGPEGIGGVEYTFEDIPLMVYGEVSVMMELADRFTPRPFGAVGARLIF
ncbi:hypothetical protein [Chryseolinea lacunae]|uniref:Outer membrane protein beta-barrel domain-containing protein n=1 Tax=Chryseolinea lacunae TaxID=2801331 RepID=A0ABS1KQ31_9BACT|nr:hypothetical protein [Chryseolinea lacunae]MBL0741584.1 hypothetical protein [Chryseolinea lacunae]